MLTFIFYLFIFCSNRPSSGQELRKAISRLESSATSTYASAQSSAAGSEAFLEAIIAVPSLPAQRSTDHPPSTSYTRTQYAQHTRDESNSNSSRSGTQTPESTLDHFFGTPRKRWGSASTYGTSVSDGSVEHVQQVLQSLAQAQAGQIQMKMPGSPPTPRRKSSLRHVGSCGDMLMVRSVLSSPCRASLFFLFAILAFVSRHLDTRSFLNTSSLSPFPVSRFPFPLPQFPIREQNEVSSLQSRQSHQSLQSTSNYSTNTASKTNSHDFAAGAAGGIRASPKSPPPPRPASQISTATTATGTSIAIKGRHQNQQRNTADSSLTILGFGKAI